MGFGAVLRVFLVILDGFWVVFEWFLADAGRSKQRSKGL